MTIKSRYVLLSVLFAAMAGAMFLYPHVYLTWKYTFAGYEKTIQYDESIYAGRIANPSNDPYIWETKNGLTPHEMLPVKIFALFERCLGVENLLICWDFLGPFLYVVIFFAVVRWSLSRFPELVIEEFLILAVGILSSCFFVACSTGLTELLHELLSYYVYHTKSVLFINPRAWLENVKGHNFSRIFYPALNVPLLVLFVGLFVKWLRASNTSYRYLVVGKIR